MQVDACANLSPRARIGMRLATRHDTLSLAEAECPSWDGFW